MTTQKPIPMILVTGFLGAGKTTLIGNMLKQLDTGYRIALVQNEYSASGTDTRILRQAGRDFEILEVTQGSVFCVCLLGSFIPSLSAFLDDKEPDILLLESTGLADPIAVAEILQDPGLSQRVYLASIWCVVDARNYGKLSRVNLRITRQVQVADYILVNKTDLLKKVPDDLMETLATINPGALIHPTSFSRFPDTKMLEPLPDPQAILRQALHAGVEPMDRSDIRTIVIRTTSTITRDKLELFLSEIAPLTIRMKGYVLVSDGHPLEIQHVFGETSLYERAQYDGQTELVGLGWGIDSKNFGRRFHEIRKQSVHGK